MPSTTSQFKSLKKTQKVARSSSLPSAKGQTHNSSYVVYIPKDVGVEKQFRGKSSSCHLYKMVVVAILLSTFAVCAFVWITTSVIEKRVLSRVTSQLQHLGHEHAVGNLNLNDQSLEIRRRSTNRRRRNRRRRRGQNAGRHSNSPSRRSAVNSQTAPEDQLCHHHRRAAPRMPSTVHLQIKSEGIFKIRDQPALGVQRDYFVWSEANSRTSTRFRFERAPNFESGKNITGVKIIYPGIYEVYSQVVIKGLTDGRLPYSCAQEIVLIRGNNITTLLRSYLTQNGLGRQMLGEIPENGEWWPLDTSYQYGVFFLIGQDQLRVSYSTNCGNVRFSNADPQAFYFGVAEKK